MHFNANGNGIGVMYLRYHIHSHGSLQFLFWREIRRQPVKASLAAAISLRLNSPTHPPNPRMNVKRKQGPPLLFTNSVWVL